MCFANSLLIIFFACLIAKEVQCDEYKDDPPATNVTLFGENMCCAFVFTEGVDIKEVQYFAPNAKKNAIAVLRKHQIAFAAHPDPFLISVTIDENEEWDVYGVAYLMTIDEYNDYREHENIFVDIRIGHAVTEKVEVEIEGKTTEIDCNATLSAGQAAVKPPKGLIKMYSELYAAAGIPQDYIDKFATLPTCD